MAEIKQYSKDVAGRPFSIETGRMAGLAHGAVTVRYGDTVILATAVVSAEPREGIDFFPLMVDYEERLYAAGKISGSRFIKREGRPSEAAILNARLIDRPIRPLFPKQFKNDVQVICTILSYDGENDPDIVAITAASAALMMSPAPFHGPVAGVRVGLIPASNEQPTELADSDSIPEITETNFTTMAPGSIVHDSKPHRFVLNPTSAEREQSVLDLVVAGNKDRINMIEAGASQVDEATMLEAFKFAHEQMQPLLELQMPLESQNKVIVSDEETNPVVPAVTDLLGGRLAQATEHPDKATREANTAELLTEVTKALEGQFKQADIKSVFSQLVETEVRKAIIDKGIRPDGRAIDEIRQISGEVSLLPRTHGSALFTRGTTQALTIATLGGPGEEQMIDTMELEGEKRYMHHYNFPPFSVGEAKPIRGASRREIGHGALAERALIPVLPSKEDFPYTIRLVSEILASNGSSSMAATCGSTLALMDAGVPISSPVAGIAIGLITESESGKRDKYGDIGKYVVLTDIQGIEDFAGDMDFKITGTKDGITAIQLDTKLAGLSFEIIEETLAKAKAGREHILGIMQTVIPEVRAEMSPYAPRIITVQIPVDKIGSLIGPGGKNIKKIVDDAGGKELISIDIDDDGTVSISSTDSEAAAKAKAVIEGMTKEIKVGEIYEATITDIIKDRNSGKEIGAIAEFAPGKDGMIHISELSNERVPSVSSVVTQGQQVTVKVTAVDTERGRISLSMKQAQAPAQEESDTQE
jgi:polyribonucleotide nucleotidyltransferase